MLTFKDFPINSYVSFLNTKCFEEFGIVKGLTRNSVTNEVILKVVDTHNFKHSIHPANLTLIK